MSKTRVMLESYGKKGNTIDKLAVISSTGDIEFRTEVNISEEDDSITSVTSRFSLTKDQFTCLIESYNKFEELTNVYD